MILIFNMNNYLDKVTPLSNDLKQKIFDWKQNDFPKYENLYKNLDEKGQQPSTMIISCCDSRVNPNSLFQSEIGAHFIHRNIANLVPENSASSHFYGTSAAIEYAVNYLKVSHIVILGHSKCGGIKACFDFFESDNKNKSFIELWLEILKPTFKSLNKKLGRSEMEKILEKEAILNSLKNLLTYSFVKQRVEQNTLSIHGVWQNLKDASIEYYDNIQGKFVPLE